MTPSRTSAPQAQPDLAQRARRLEPLSAQALAARCLAGIGELEEVVLGPRARHAARLLEALLERKDPRLVDALQAELLEARRELSARCAALAALERAGLEAAERELVLTRELEELRRALPAPAAGEPEPGPDPAEERAALELARAALAQIESELAALRRERDWRAAEMEQAARELERLRFRILAPELEQRARRWKEGPP